MPVFRCAGTESPGHKAFLHVDDMQAAAIQTGDVVQVRTADVQDSLQQLSISNPEHKAAYATAWPSKDIDRGIVLLNTVTLFNSGATLGTDVTLTKIKDLGYPRKEAATLTLIKDAHAGPVNVGKDSFFNSAVKVLLTDLRFISIGNFVQVSLAGNARRVFVYGADLTDGSPAAPDTVLEVSLATKIVFKSKSSVRDGPSSAKLNLSSVDAPGFPDVLALLHKALVLPTEQPELFVSYNIPIPHGVLLHGPSGSGKTHLARQVSETAPDVVINLDICQCIEDKSYLGKAFGDVCARIDPCILIIDNIDLIAAQAAESGKNASSCIAQLLSFFDNLGAQQPVTVLGITNKVDQIDPSLRRSGRFGTEIEMAVPSLKNQVLSSFFNNIPHQVSEGDLDAFSKRLHGFVIADIEQLVQTACLDALTDKSPAVTSKHLESALTRTSPSALRQVLVQTPNVRWTDIGGQNDTKLRLQQSVQWPLIHADAFARLGLEQARGVLLYGPPGCSKTLMAKALATESGLNFMSVKGPEVFSMYVGESERNVREVFRKARSAAPSIVFLDEVDAIAAKRGGSDGGSSKVDNRVVMTLLTEMDGVEELRGVVIVAATNRPDIIDPALMRPGRLDRIIYVGPPDFDARKQILQNQLSKMAAGDIDYDELAALTEGCSGAEVAGLSQTAGLYALEESISIPAVGQRHLLRAAADIRRNITPEMLHYYTSWAESSGIQRV